jgi:hypothetical protein
VTSFSSTVNKGSSSDPGTPGGSTACKVAYGTNVWQGGFTADVTITNTGASPVNGWKLAFTLPSGQRITNAWNANLSGSSRGGHREQRRPQRRAEGRRPGDLRVPGHLRRNRQQALGLQPERHRLHHRLTHARPPGSARFHHADKRAPEAEADTP